MLFSSSQHQKMAAILDEKAKAQRDPDIQKKQLELANVFRTLARRAEQKKPKLANKIVAAMDRVPNADVDGRKEEFLVTKADLPIVMLDDPPPLATLETWEQHLAEVQSMQDFQGKKNRIAHAKWMIARKKRSRAQAKTKA
jgi:hypothetical protein